MAKRDAVQEEAEEIEEVEDLNEVANEYGFSLSDPLDDAEVEPTNAFIYGMPGAGKTGLAFTAPDPLLLDFEKGGRATARAVLKSLQANGEASKVARIVTIDYVESSVGTPAQDAMNKVRAVYKYLRAGNHPFRSVIIDPVGQLQALLMAEVLEKYPSRRVYGNQPAMQDWGKALSDAEKMIKAFRALPMHTIITAHAEQPKEDTEDVHPLLTGKNFGPFLEGAMDLLGYLYREETVPEDGAEGEKTITRILQTAADGRIRAKNRGERLPMYAAEPNLTDIFAVMEASDDE